MKKILYSKFVLCIMEKFFGIFYNKKYLNGYFFTTKRMGWLWAFRSLKNHIFGENKNVPWPVHPRTIVNGSENIHFPQDSLNVFQVPGCYWQAHDAKIEIGHNCYVAPNVGIITTNHNTLKLSEHLPGENIKISNDCWIGMNAVILPGVELGEHTVVAAGAAVSKSFKEGWCVIGGVPAKIIKKIERCEANESN